MEQYIVFEPGTDPEQPVWPIEGPYPVESQFFEVLSRYLLLCSDHIDRHFVLYAITPDTEVVQEGILCGTARQVYCWLHDTLNVEVSYEEKRQVGIVRRLAAYMEQQRDN